MTTPIPDVEWARAKVVLDEVLDVAPEARAAELERRCGGDETLRAAVAGLLAALDDCEGFLADPAAADSEPASVSIPPSDRRIGQYRILRELGRGGMGIVYEAVQDRPRRTVALKLLHASIASSRVTERFVREAELLAHLDHPNIARVYDAGTHDDGFGSVPYFAMELIKDARPITEHVQTAALPVRARVELFLTVCDAVQYGHQRGIIHRDLKPGNILVGGGDDRRARVIDFGVARTTEADLSMASLQTGANEIIGTLRYMSPEQCTGNAHEVDVRCDVYALGVVLYEVLAGRLPYDFETTSVFEIPRLICETAPRRLPSSHDGDLETIVLRALEKSRDRRYQSVHELAGDLRRYLNGEPIEAKRDHTWYVMRKTIGRHRTAVSVAVAFVMLVSMATAALGVLYARAERQAERLRRVGYFQTIALAEHALQSSRTDELQQLLEQCPEDLRGWEWWYLSGRVDESVATLHTAPYVGAALSPDGRLLASGIRGGVEIWDLQRRERLARHSIGAGFVETLSFSPDGGLLAVGTRSGDPSWVLDARTGTPVLEIPATERVKAVCMLPDGRRLVTGSAHGALTVRALESGAVLRVLTDAGTWVTALGLSPDATTLAAGRDDGTIETWDLVSGGLGFRVDRAHAARVSGLVFGADGVRLHSSGWDAAVKMWDQAGQQLDVRQTEGNPVRGIALSGDGKVLAVVTTTSIELRDAMDGTLKRRVLGQANGHGVAFRQPLGDHGDHGGQGGEMVTWSREAIKIWDLERRRGAFDLGRHDALAEAVATSPDGRWVASAARGGAIVLWDAANGASAAQWDGGFWRVYRLAFSPEGARLAGACHDGAARVWSLPGGVLEREFRCDDSVIHVQWKDDDVVLAASHNGVLSAWSCNDGQRRWAVDSGQDGLASIACDSGGAHAATGGRDGTIRIWALHPPGPKLVRTLSAHERSIGDLAWSNDGAMLASGADDGVVRLWNADDGSLRAELSGHGGLIKAVDFSPDGTRLATSAWEGEIRLWDTAGGACVLRLRGHVGVVMDVDFTADGRRLVSAGHDGTVRVWEAPLSR